MALQSCYFFTFIGLFSICYIRVCPAEDLDCSLFAAVNFPKYLDCPLVNATDEISSSGDASSLTIVNVSWYIDCLFVYTCDSFRIDYFGVHSGSVRTFENVEVTSTGQLYIPNVPRFYEMQLFNFECKVWNESISQWSQSYRLEKLKLLNYGPLYNENYHIPKNTFQEPLLREEAVIGTNKVLCIQGEVLKARVEWTKVEPTYQSFYQVDSDAHISTLTSRCFECECMIDLITSNEGLQLLSNIDDSVNFVSFTATGYYLPQSFDTFIHSLECVGIPNWFLSVLLIRNVSEPDTGNYEVTVRSNRSILLNHTRRFTLNTGYLQVEPDFRHTIVNSQTTEFIIEGSAAYYICNATIPVSSFLVWKRLDNKTVPTVKHVTPLTSYDANDLCQAYAHNRDTISLIISNSTVHTPEGVVSGQAAVLVICNMKSSTVGVYQCVAKSQSMGEIKNGPQVSIDITPSDLSPSNNNMLVPYVTMSCVLITILLLLAILIIMITHFWLKYKSKQHQRDDTVIHRRKEENIYYDVHPHVNKNE